MGFLLATVSSKLTKTLQNLFLEKCTIQPRLTAQHRLTESCFCQSRTLRKTGIIQSKLAPTFRSVALMKPTPGYLRKPTLFGQMPASTPSHSIVTQIYLNTKLTMK